MVASWMSRAAITVTALCDSGGMLFMAFRLFKVLYQFYRIKLYVLNLGFIHTESTRGR